MVFVIVAANLECLRGNAGGIDGFGETQIEAVFGEVDAVHVHRHRALPGEFLNTFAAGPTEMSLPNIERAVGREGQPINSCGKAIFIIEGNRCALRHPGNRFWQVAHDARNIHFAAEHLIGVRAKLACGGIEQRLTWRIGENRMRQENCLARAQLVELGDGNGERVAQHPVFAPH